MLLKLHACCWTVNIIITNDVTIWPICYSLTTGSRGAHACTHSVIHQTACESMRPWAPCTDIVMVVQFIEGEGGSSGQLCNYTCIFEGEGGSSGQLCNYTCILTLPMKTTTVKSTDTTHTSATLRMPAWVYTRKRYTLVCLYVSTYLSVFLIGIHAVFTNLRTHRKVHMCFHCLPYNQFSPILLAQTQLYVFITRLMSIACLSKLNTGMI